jgi:hypothetical protein
MTLRDALRFDLGTNGCSREGDEVATSTRGQSTSVTM